MQRIRRGFIYYDNEDIFIIHFYHNEPLCVAQIYKLYDGEHNMTTLGRLFKHFYSLFDYSV